jgi:muramidase (phage lysozyme)
MSDVYPNRSAFLAMLGWSEGTRSSSATKCDGYDVIVTGADGRPEVFSDFSAHPFAAGRPAKVVQPGLYSTASGRYQVLLRYWLAYAKSLGLTDFSPASQDAIALQQIRERGALPLIDGGNIQLAIQRCSKLWASLPGSGYAQPEQKMDRLLVAFVAAGGKVAP